ncbi:MAG TPA: hypothetical protein VK691_13830 [Solirubrobacteraceae bacterium]|nr:hypothetical protein [Solirubrobacteraceae bacterium]
MILQLEIIALDKLQKLTNLVWLGLSTHGLQVEEFGHCGVRKDAVTSSDSTKLKAESLREGTQIDESHVGDRAAIDAPQKPSLVHLRYSDKEAKNGHAPIVVAEWN